MSSPLPPVDVRFTDIVYEVPSTPQTRLPTRRPPAPPIRILSHISGYVPAGHSLAILGPSGSGKTSLLNVLAARTNYPPTSGTILFASRPRLPRTKRHIAYVMQDDVFFSKLTVRETLDFTANIRLPSAVSPADKRARVRHVIDRLRLAKCANTRIGDQQFDKGISGGERKRLNIANELLHDPSLILADEATSGLDSSSAFTVIRLLSELTREGRTVICTIHQPSSQMFTMFDNIMLLAAGRVAYFGTPQHVVRYFEAIDFPFPEAAYNPADYMLELIIDDRPSEHDPSLPSVQERILTAWEHDGPVRAGMTHLLGGDGGGDVRQVAESKDSAHVVMVLDEAPKELAGTGAGHLSESSTAEEFDSHESGAKADVVGLRDPDPPVTYAGRVARAWKKRFWDVTWQHGKHGERDKYPTDWVRQVMVLGTRAMRQKRGVLLEPMYIAQVIAVTTISALAWFRIEPSERTIEDRLGALSFSCIFWAFYSTFNALFAFPAEKQVLNKDRAGGVYRLSAYYFAKSMIETPADMIYPAFYAVIVYFIIGLNPYFPSFVLFTVTLVLNVLTAQSLGLLISSFVMDVRKAQVVASVTILSSMLLSGYYIDPDNTPSFIEPFRFLSFIKYSYETLVRIEMLNGRSFECVEELSTIYSNNGENCPVRLDDVLRGAQLEDSLSIPLGILVLIAWIVSTRLLGYFALKLSQTSHKPKLKSWK